MVSPKRKRRAAPRVSRTPKGDKRARTRAAIIEAAAEVIGRRGYERTSLEEIAQAAGMSRGAVYGNFRDKEDIFVAVAMTYWGPVIPPPYEPDDTLLTRMTKYGVAVADAAEARRAHAAGAVSFTQYALGNSRLRAMIEAANAQIYSAATARLITSIAQHELRVPPDSFVRAVHALTEGFVVLHALTPSLITREHIVAAFEALA